MPRVLVSPQSNDDKLSMYLVALQEAGAEPVVVDSIEHLNILCEQADGWLVTGGGDIPPAMYGETPHPETKAMSENDPRLVIDKRLYERLEPTDLPILGICLGAQVLNVFPGVPEESLESCGTLLQHMDGHREGAEIQIAVQEGSRLSSMGLGKTFLAGCYHHQAIERVRRSWRVAARAADGTIEAIEEESSRWRLGVQWHPERTLERKHSKKLFRSFVEACANQR